MNAWHVTVLVTYQAMIKGTPHRDAAPCGSLGA
jgi:hypothetical protein